MRIAIMIIALIAFYLYLVTEHVPFAVVAIINVIMYVHADIIRQIKNTKAGF